MGAITDDVVYPPAERPVLIHELQKVYLHQLVQSRLFTEEAPLTDCYQCLHSFCLALQLDCLYSQVAMSSLDRAIIPIVLMMCIHAGCSIEFRGVWWVCESRRVFSWSAYQVGLLAFLWLISVSQCFSSQPEQKSVAILMHSLVYCPSLTASTWPKVVISVDPCCPGCPFSTSHYPSLSGLSEVGVSQEALSLEGLLEGCIAARSTALLEEMVLSLRGTMWQKNCQ